MATFEAQVEGLTSLAIDGSSAPTQTELTQFLTDGAAEVINSMPLSLKTLCATEDTFTSAAVGSEAETLESAQVLSVTLNDGTIEQPCRKIPAELRGKASDSDDMIAASVTDPVYYIYNGKLNALPASRSCKYLEVNNPAVAYGDSAISNFPDEYEYLVPLYASIKSIQNKMGSLSEGLTVLNITDSAPTIPSLATVSYSNASNADASAQAVSPITVSTVNVASVSSSAPAYSKPDLTTRVSFEDFFNLSEDGNPFGDNDPGVFSVSKVPPTPPVSPSYTSASIDSVSISNIGIPPTYTAPTVAGATEELTATITDGTIGTDADFQDFSDWFEVLGHMIEDEEDTELAQAQVQKISTYLRAYQEAMNNNLNTYNKENAAYQGKLKEALQQAQINSQKAIQEPSVVLQQENQEYQAKLSKFSNDLQSYQAQVNSEVKEYNEKFSRYQLEVNTAFQAWSKTEADSLQQYSIDIQNELNEFNKENVLYQATVKSVLDKHQTDLQVNLNQARINSEDAKQEAAQTTDVDKFNKAQDQALSLANAAKTIEGVIANNDDLIQKFNAELAKYGALVNKGVQQYQANLENSTAEYNWWEKQQLKLQADYDKGIQRLGAA
tara:strand:- start:2037 stop:3869 length:1833 start_codon:yes stop_codon:yes gene_type:complete